MVKIFSVNMSITYGVVPPPPPPPVPPPPPPSCCLATGSLVRLVDCEKPIEQVRAGDLVVTLQGVRRVKRLERTKLGRNRGMMCIGRLCMSDDHDIWVRHKGEEGWATFNFPFWLTDAAAEGTTDVGAWKFEPGQRIEAACEFGFVEVKPIFNYSPPPSTELWNLEIENGGSFMADGFMVIANRCRPEHIEGVQWQGVYSLPGCSGPAQTTSNVLSMPTSR